MTENNFDFNFQDQQFETPDEKIIADDSKLDTEYIPDNISHRDQIIQDLLQNTFGPIANGKKGNNAVLIGPPGSGKTACTKFITKNTKDNNDSTLFEILYVNCSTYSSGQAVFRNLLEQVGQTFKPGVELTENINRFKNEIKKKDDKAILVVLDEIHCLAEGRNTYMNEPVLYQLSRLKAGMKNSEEWEGALRVLCISNDENIMSKIDKDMKSSLQADTHSFTEYSKEDIFDILQTRQEEAYAERILSDSSLGLISEEVKNNFESDIRAGIDILKKIPRKAKSVDKLKSDQRYQVQLVRETLREVQADNIEQVFHGKNDSFYLVMESLHQQLREDKARLKYITEGYLNICEQSNTEKEKDTYNKNKNWVHRQLQELVDADLLEHTHHHKEDSTPRRYKPNFDIELFGEVTAKYLKQLPVWNRLEKSEEKLSAGGKQAHEEAESYLDSLELKE